ncbi:DMP19 family protein [Croceivirga radicis]|uniref:DMP19 family protein n=1 Tax=Croceivirga radicis TaxID=1929488 RepID=UPI000255AEB0|nr:DUF4375 domain-containing protein [Croceivirga radicis]
MIRKVKYGISELKNSNDQELIELVFEKASELYFETFGESLEKADGAMADYFAIWKLDADVKNGGFDQFFLNNGIESGHKALDGFSRIGAIKFMELTQKAIVIFENQNSEFENKRNPDFDILDDEYHDSESWEELQIEYIRGNYDKFVVE